MLQRKFMDAILYNRIEEAKYYLLNTDINPIVNKHDPLKKAAFYGYTEIIELLSQDKRVKIDYQNNIILKIAFEKGHFTSCMKILDLYISKFQEPEIFNKNHLTMCLYLDKKDIFITLLKIKEYSDIELEDALIASQFYQDKWVIPLIINKININEKWVDKYIQNKSYKKLIKSHIKIINF